uniref:Putative secreted protein n=1 Tax=Ixodes ricinus TaxID=34613 RepID=A0A147BSD2_IXORI
MFRPGTVVLLAVGLAGGTQQVRDVAARVLQGPGLAQRFPVVAGHLEAVLGAGGLLVVAEPRAAHALGRPDLKEVHEVGQQGEQVLAHRGVHKEHVLHRQEAHVVGQVLVAEALGQLQVVQRVGQAHGLVQAQVLPGQEGRAVEAEQGGQGAAVAQLPQVLHHGDVRHQGPPLVPAVLRAAGAQLVLDAVPHLHRALVEPEQGSILRIHRHLLRVAHRRKAPDDLKDLDGDEDLLDVEVHDAPDDGHVGAHAQGRRLGQHRLGERGAVLGGLQVDPLALQGPHHPLVAQAVVVGVRIDVGQGQAVQLCTGQPLPNLGLQPLLVLVVPVERVPQLGGHPVVVRLRHQPQHRGPLLSLGKVVLVDGRQLRRVVVVIHRWLVARAKASRDTGLTSAFRSGRGLASLLSHGPGVRDGAAQPRQRVFGPPATAWPQLAAVPSA